MELIKIKPEVHNKGWGTEIWLCNSEKCCGKLLVFKKDSQFSLHYHLKKHEWFYVLKGELDLRYKDLRNGKDRYLTISEGDVVEIPTGFPHQLRALEDSTIIEISTEHFDEDSYRIEGGDSQK